MAELLRQIGLPADARAALDTTAALSGDPAEFVVARAATYADESDWASAADVLGQLEPEKLERLDFAFPLAVLRERAGQLEQAEAGYARIVQTTPIARAYADLGRVLERSGRGEDAQAAYIRALTIDPDNAEALVRSAQLADVPTFESSVRALEIALAALADASAQQSMLAPQTLGAGMSPTLADDQVLDPRDLEAKRLERLSALVESAFRFMTEQDAVRADSVVRDLVRRYSASPTVRSLAGSFYERQGEPERARAEYEQSVSLAPGRRDAHLALGRIAERLGDDRAALGSYERALALDETQPEAYRALVRLYRSQGALDALIRRWHARYRAHPFNTVLRDHLLDALNKAGRTDEARHLVQEADDERTQR